MSNSNFVVCLPTFFSPQDKRSTGGTISNFSLIKELAGIGNVEVISPIVSPELIHNENNRVKVITSPGLEGDSLSKKVKKKIWLRKQIHSRAAYDTHSIFISTNGTASFVNSAAPRRSIILTRAFEDFLDYEVNGENFKEKVRKKILSFIVGERVKKCYTNADRVITNSKFMRGEISRYFEVDENKIMVLYPPVDFPDAEYRPLPKNRKLRIGMINPKKIKGEDIFIGLAKEFKEIDFVYFSKEDRKYGISNIMYQGWGSEPKKLFQSFDVLIAPSLWDEPFGRVAVEGIRSGIPVLVSNHGGIPETVTDDFVVDSDTVVAWKEKVKWLQDNPEAVAASWDLSNRHTEKFISHRHNEKLKEYFRSYLLEGGNI
ncbi:hypothetical protein ED28_14770 [[Pantoea] beijingensis]|uniref:Glycosyl transferase family 1 domain-containing protein n=1 Tax=[Pantoea] beijingensis TaxID=1324864 RepID=A0A443IAD8_9GAMM|nr:glycosyltransferase family 4 protein [[Pantoea] beijingensis]RWR01181.1 hypothetical protein ED28_14770 [[Pantoea] beijingensis]